MTIPFKAIELTVQKFGYKDVDDFISKNADSNRGDSIAEEKGSDLAPKTQIENSLNSNEPQESNAKLGNFKVVYSDVRVVGI